MDFTAAIRNVKRIAMAITVAFDGGATATFAGILQEALGSSVLGVLEAQAISMAADQMMVAACKLMSRIANGNGISVKTLERSSSVAKVTRAVDDVFRSFSVGGALGVAADRSGATKAMGDMGSRAMKAVSDRVYGSSKAEYDDSKDNFFIKGK